MGTFSTDADLDGLESSEQSENIINRKIGNFYIEAIPKNFPQLQQKIFFRARPKIFLGIWGHFGFW